MDAPDGGRQAAPAVPRPPGPQRAPRRPAHGTGRGPRSTRMTGLQIALASGALLGLALALLVWRLAPSDPDLVDALDRLSPDHVVPRRSAHGLDDAGPDTGSAVDRIGLWAMKNLPGGAWAHTPRKDLALLQISETRFYGEKVVWAMLGLIMPPQIGRAHV